MAASAGFPVARFGVVVLPVVGLAVAARPTSSREYGWPGRW